MSKAGRLGRRTVLPRTAGHSVREALASNAEAMKKRDTWLRLSGAALQQLPEGFEEAVRRANTGNALTNLFFTQNEAEKAKTREWLSQLMDEHGVAEGKWLLSVGPDGIDQIQQLQDEVEAGALDVSALELTTTGDAGVLLGIYIRDYRDRAANAELLRKLDALGFSLGKARFKPSGATQIEELLQCKGQLRMLLPTEVQAVHHAVSERQRLRRVKTFTLPKVSTAEFENIRESFDPKWIMSGLKASAA